MTSVTTPRARSNSVRGILVGTALVVVPVVLLVAMLALGVSDNHGRTAVAPVVPAAANTYPRLLAAVPIILAACYLAGAVMRRLGQPAVIGEIIAGVMLGPSLFGLVSPVAFAWVFPADVDSVINTLSQIGLIFFMFMVGAHIDLGALRGQGLTAAAVTYAGIGLSMFAGIVLAFAMYPTLGGHAGFLPFALFIAVSMSVTAFPVLARILTDRGISATPLGVLAISCAAGCDVAAWCLLAMVTAVSHGGPPTTAIWTIGLVAGFAVLMVLAVHPVLTRVLARSSEPAALPILLGGIMLSALATNDFGIHPIFGAFLFGVIVPRDSAPVRKSSDKMESITVSLLLPLFFVYTGLHTKFGLLGASGRLWAWCALITVVAILAKWVSSTTAARLTGVGWQESLSLGALMNCRGVTELVVLGVGLQLKVISPTVFAMLVIMTLASTLATSPGLSLIERVRPNVRQR